MHSALSIAKAGAADLARWALHSLILRRRAAILMYHSIGDAPIFIAVREPEFAWQMEYLALHGYRVTSLMELVRIISGGSEIPPKTVVLTFDDGYEDNYSAAFPLLRRYGFPATIFVTTDWIGNKDLAIRRGGLRFRMLDETQICEMNDSGLVSFASHTRSHPHISRLSSADAMREIMESKAALEHVIPAIPAFAYPYGEYGPAAQAIIRTRFRAAVTVRQALVSPNESLWELPRQSVDSLVTKARFPFKLPA